MNHSGTKIRTKLQRWASKRIVKRRQDEEYPNYITVDSGIVTWTVQLE